MVRAVVSAISGLQVPQVLLDDQGHPRVSNGEYARAPWHSAWQIPLYPPYGGY